MTIIEKQFHWRAIDFRYESLVQIITGLDNSIKSINERSQLESWYDGLWVLEDTEPIFGLGFIAFQNYINGSIKDLYKTVTNKIIYYKLEPRLLNFEKNSIELIIGLANFIKHKEDGELHKPTKEILTCFDLIKSDDITDSPIFKGLDLLSENWSLFTILKIVTSWRKKLYDNFLEHSRQCEF